MNKPREFWLTCFISTGWNWAVSDKDLGCETYPRENNYEKHRGKSYQIHVREVTPQDGAKDKLIEYIIQTGRADNLEALVRNIREMTSKIVNPEGS